MKILFTLVLIQAAITGTLAATPINIDEKLNVFPVSSSTISLVSDYTKALANHNKIVFNVLIPKDVTVVVTSADLKIKETEHIGSFEIIASITSFSRDALTISLNLTFKQADSADLRIIASANYFEDTFQVNLNTTPKLEISNKPGSQEFNWDPLFGKKFGKVGYQIFFFKSSLITSDDVYSFVLALLSKSLQDYDYDEFDGNTNIDSGYVSNINGYYESVILLAIDNITGRVLKYNSISSYVSCNLQNLDEALRLSKFGDDLRFCFYLSGNKDYYLSLTKNLQGFEDQTNGFIRSNTLKVRVIAKNIIQSIPFSQQERLIKLLKWSDQDLLPALVLLEFKAPAFIKDEDDYLIYLSEGESQTATLNGYSETRILVKGTHNNIVTLKAFNTRNDNFLLLSEIPIAKLTIYSLSTDKVFNQVLEVKDKPDREPYSLKLDDSDEIKIVLEVDKSKITDLNKTFVIRMTLNDYEETHSGYGSTVNHYLYDESKELSYFFDLDDTYGDYLKHGFLSLSPNHDLSKTKALLVKSYSNDENRKPEEYFTLDGTDRGFLIVNPFEYGTIEVTTFLKSDSKNYLLTADLIEFNWLSDNIKEVELTIDTNYKGYNEPTIYKFDLESSKFANIVTFFPDSIQVKASVSLDFPLLHSDDIFKESEVYFNNLSNDIRTIEISKYSVANNGAVYISFLPDQDTKGLIFLSNDIYEAYYSYDSMPVNYNLSIGKAKYIICYPDYDPNFGEDYILSISKYSGNVSVTYELSENLNSLPTGVLQNSADSGKFTTISAAKRKYIAVRVETQDEVAIGDISLFQISKSANDISVESNDIKAYEIAGSKQNITHNVESPKLELYTISTARGTGSILANGKSFILQSSEDIVFYVSTNAIFEVTNTSASLIITISRSSKQTATVWHPDESDKLELTPKQKNIVIIEFKPNSDFKRDIIFDSADLVNFSYFFEKSSDPISEVYYSRFEEKEYKDYSDYLVSFSEIHLPDTTARLVIFANLQESKTLKATLTLKNYTIDKLNLKIRSQVYREDDLYYFRIPPSDNSEYNLLTFTFIKSVDTDDQVCKIQIGTNFYYARNNQEKIVAIIDATSFSESGIVCELACFIHTDKPEDVSPFYLNTAYVSQTYSKVVDDGKAKKLRIQKSSENDGKEVSITIAAPSFFKGSSQIKFQYKLLFAKDNYLYDSKTDTILYDSILNYQDFYENPEVFDNLPIVKNFPSENKEYRVAVVAFDPNSTLESATNLAIFNTLGVDKKKLENNIDTVLEINQNLDLEIPNPSSPNLTLAFNVFTSSNNQKYSILSQGLNMSSVKKTGPSILIVDISKADFNKNKYYISIKSDDNFKAVVSAYYFKRDPSVDYTGVPKNLNLIITRLTEKQFNIEWSPLRAVKVSYLWFANNDYNDYENLNDYVISKAENGAIPSNIFKESEDTKISNFLLKDFGFYRFITIAKDSQTGRYVIYNVLKDFEVCNYISLNTPYLFAKNEKLLKAACFKSSRRTILLNISDNYIGNEDRSPVSLGSSITYRTKNGTNSLPVISHFVPIDLDAYNDSVYIFDFNLKFTDDSSDITVTLIDSSDSSLPIKLGDQEFSYFVNSNYNTVVNISPQISVNSISTQSLDLLSPFVNISDVKLFTLNKDGSRTLISSVLKAKPLKAGTPFSYKYAKKDNENVSFQIEVDTKNLFDNDHFYIRVFRNENIWLINEDVQAKAFYYDNNNLFYGLVDLSNQKNKASDFVYTNGKINYEGEFKNISIAYSTKRKIEEITVNDFNFIGIDSKIVDQGKSFVFDNRAEARFILIKAQRSYGVNFSIKFQFDWRIQQNKAAKEGRLAFLE